jgi:hypothetical protein
VDAIIYLQPREQTHARAIKTGLLTKKEYEGKKRVKKWEGKGVCMPQAREHTQGAAARDRQRAYVSIRQHTSAYVSIRQQLRAPPKRADTRKRN